MIIRTPLTLFTFLTIFLTDISQAMATEEWFLLTESPAICQKEKRKTIERVTSSRKEKMLLVLQEKNEKERQIKLSKDKEAKNSLILNPENEEIKNKLAPENQEFYLVKGDIYHKGKIVVGGENDALKYWADSASQKNKSAQKVLRELLGPIARSESNFIDFSKISALQQIITKAAEQHAEEYRLNSGSCFQDFNHDTRELVFLRKMVDFYDYCLTVATAFTQSGFMVQFNKMNPKLDYFEESTNLQIKRDSFICYYPSLGGLTCYSEDCVNKGNLLCALRKEPANTEPAPFQDCHNKLSSLEQNLNELEIKNIILKAEIKLTHTKFMHYKEVGLHQLIKLKDLYRLQNSLEKNRDEKEEIYNQLTEIREEKEELFTFSQAKMAYQNKIKVHEAALNSPELHFQVSQLLQEMLNRLKNSKETIESIEQMTFSILTKGIYERNQLFLNDHPWFENKTINCLIS